MRLDISFYKQLLDNLHEGVYIVDSNKKITYWNKGAERITGFGGEEVLGKKTCDEILKHIDEQGRHLCRSGCLAECAMADGEHMEGSYYISHKEGHRLPVLICKSPVIDDNDEIMGAVEIFSDHSWNVAAVQRIEELKGLALLDPLTEAGNRRHAEMTLNARFDEMKRYGTAFGILMIDLDDFKRINDTHGHGVGDKVIKMTAKTISLAIRPFDSLCRYGGEEFMCILGNIKGDYMKPVAERLRMLIEQSALKESGGDIRVTVSIGGAVSSREDAIDTIIRRADGLLYKSKAEGKNRVTIQ